MKLINSWLNSYQWNLVLQHLGINLLNLPLWNTILSSAWWRQPVEFEIQLAKSTFELWQDAFKPCRRLYWVDDQCDELFRFATVQTNHLKLLKMLLGWEVIPDRASNHHLLQVCRPFSTFHYALDCILDWVTNLTYIHAVKLGSCSSCRKILNELVRYPNPQTMLKQ